MNILVRRNNTPAFNQLFNEFFQDPFFNTEAPALTEAAEAMPLDLSEDDKTVIIRASLPGFSKEDIQVDIHEGILTIQAQHTEETESNEKFYRRERRTGAASRRIRLPDTVTHDQAHAELKDGILTLRIPKTEKALPRKIQIN